MIRIVRNTPTLRMMKKKAKRMKKRKKLIMTRKELMAKSNLR
jgi:hypothetical protein